jgi:hypothetical protein
MEKLSQQATIVALAAVLPVLVSTYKLHISDALILAIVSSIAVYNVNCLTKGGCGVWATLVAISFFVTSLIQIRNLEGYNYTFKQVFDTNFDIPDAITKLKNEIEDYRIDKIPAQLRNLAKDLCDEWWEKFNEFNSKIANIGTLITKINDYDGKSTVINSGNIQAMRDLTESYDFDDKTAFGLPPF